MRKSFEQFPEGYRHLAYLQTRIGYNVKKDMPGLKGPAVEALYARGGKSGWRPPGQRNSCNKQSDSLRI